MSRVLPFQLVQKPYAFAQRLEGLKTEVWSPAGTSAGEMDLACPKK